jgi:hypothetical protein
MQDVEKEIRLSSIRKVVHSKNIGKRKDNEKVESLVRCSDDGEDSRQHLRITGTRT